MPNRLAAALVAVLVVAFATIVPASAETGIASWYGSESGSRTASGHHFNPEGATCARPSYRAGHPTYWVRVTVLSSGRSCPCLVNDRGPAGWTGAIIDVSKGVARCHGIIGQGRARVRVEVGR